MFVLVVFVNLLIVSKRVLQERVVKTELVYLVVLAVLLHSTVL